MSRHAQRDFGAGRVSGAAWASFDPHHWTLSIGIIGADDYGDGPEASLAVGVGPFSVGLRLGIERGWLRLHVSKEHPAP